MTPPDRAALASLLLGVVAARAACPAADPLALDPGEARALAAAGLDWTTAAWTLADAARAALIVAAAQRLSAQRLRVHVEQLWRFGDAAERRALALCLELLPRPASFADLAARMARDPLDAAFEALACDNPYPARRLSDAAFEQLRLKALEAGLPPRRLLGLERRAAGLRWARQALARP